MRNTRLNTLTFLFTLLIVFTISYEAVSEVLEFAPSKDTYIYKKKSTSSYGNSSSLKSKASSSREMKSFIDFDLSSVSLDAEIVSARLLLYVSRKKGSRMNVRVSAVTGGWNESTTWSTRPGVASVNEDSVSINGTGKYYEWDITGLVQQWALGAGTKYGLAIETSKGTVYFNSDENSVNNPVLIVETAGASNDDYLISNLSVNSQSSYEVASLIPEDLYYTDENYTIRSYPSCLDGLEWIRTADSDYDSANADLITFDVDEPVIVYVGYDNNAQYLPEWMSEYESGGAVIELNGSHADKFLLYEREYPAGNIVLGGNKQGGDTGANSNYLVAVAPALGALTCEPQSESFKTVEFSCSTYSLHHRSSANQAILDQAQRIGDNCGVVLTWWEALPEQTWCPFIMQNTSAKYCGPYDNFGFMGFESNKSMWNLHGDIYNDYILEQNPEWSLKSQNGEFVYNRWFPGERAMDHGDIGFIDLWFDFFIEVPSSVADGRWRGTYQDRSWNLRFLDNFNVWAPYMWNEHAVNPRTGQLMTRSDREADMFNAVRRMRERADNDAGGVKLFANIYTDVEREYLERSIHAELMDYIDFALFETWTNKTSGEAESESTWLRRINVAQDIIKNRRAVPIVQGKHDIWYALSSLLLVKENGKGMIWRASELPSDDILQKMNNLDLGRPIEDFRFTDGVYQRDWENGRVIVNPDDSKTITITLDKEYKDLETDSSIRDIVLQPKTSKILVTQ